MGERAGLNGDAMLHDPVVTRGRVPPILVLWVPVHNYICTEREIKHGFETLLGT